MRYADYLPMNDIFVVIQIVTLCLIFLIFYQVRKQYVLALKDFQKRQIRKASSMKISASRISPLEMMGSLIVEDHDEEKAALDEVKSEPPSAPKTSEPQSKQNILDDYIGDFFGGSSVPEANPDTEQNVDIESEPAQAMRELAAVNDDCMPLQNKG